MNTQNEETKKESRLITIPVSRTLIEASLLTYDLDSGYVVSAMMNQVKHGYTPATAQPRHGVPM